MERSFALAIGLVTTLAGCGQGVTPDTGIRALMTVASAQYYANAPPPAANGPAVLDLTTASSIVRVGQQNRGVSGLAENRSAAIAIALSGDKGYWIVPIGQPELAASGPKTFAAALSFSPNLAPGAYEITARAVDEAGHFGEARTFAVTAVDADAPPTGALVVSLAWDVNADLDLRVVAPGNKEIWARKINSYDPPIAGVIDQAAAEAGGILDFDSNAQCTIDGRRRENVVWRQAPPSGHYVVRVDTFSMCGEAAAYFRASATLNGIVIGQARGVGRDSDTRFSHERGAGVLVLEFDVP